MARVNTATLFFVGMMAVASACNGPSGGIGWEIGDGVSVGPTYDPGSGAIGVEFEIEFRRSVDQPTKEGIFSLLDADGNGFLTVEEWHAQEGGVANFAEFLKDMDKNGDEMISWAEFQAVTRVYKKN